MKAQVIAVTVGCTLGFVLILLGAASAARAVGFDVRHQPKRRQIVQPVAGDPDEVPMKHPHVVSAEPFSPDAFRGDLLK